MKWNANKLKSDFIKALQLALQDFLAKNKSFNCLHFVSDMGNGAFYIYVSTIKEFKYSALIEHISATENDDYTTGEFSEVLNNQAGTDGFVTIEDAKDLKFPQKTQTSDKELTNFFTEMGFSILDEILHSTSDYEEIGTLIKENLNNGKCIFVFSDDEVSYSKQFRAFLYDQKTNKITEMKEDKQYNLADSSS